MSESEFQTLGSLSTERNRYRLLLAITDLVARAKSLPMRSKHLPLRCWT
jgi:hypothetical protein